MKKILLIATGGTIACREKGRGLEPDLTPEQMLKAAKIDSGSYGISCVSLFNEDSSDIDAGHWLKLEECIEKNYDGFDGFVITHGTDTLAYTAAALSYLVKDSEKTIAITGSQRPFSAENSDAPANLRDAVETAACGIGSVNVVFGGRVISGARAKKLSTKSLTAFESVNFPLAAEFSGGKLKTVCPPPKKGKTKFCRSLNTKVIAVTLTPSMPEKALAAALENCDGAVIESYGCGSIPRKYIETVKAAVKSGKAVALATQCVFGGTDLDLYRADRSSKEETGVVQTGEMTLEHAVVKLMYSLEKGKNAREALKIFKTE